MQKAYNQLKLQNEKLELSKKKLEFQKLKLSKNETTVNEYLKEAISLFDAQTGYVKSIAGYNTSVAELNKAIGKPGFFNPKDGVSSTDYFEEFFKETLKVEAEPKKGQIFKNCFKDCFEDSPYYPQNSYEELKFKVKYTDIDKNWKKIFFWKSEESHVDYYDPLEESETDIKKQWWKFWEGK